MLCELEIKDILLIENLSLIFLLVLMHLLERQERESRFCLIVLGLSWEQEVKLIVEMAQQEARLRYFFDKKR